MMNEKKEVIEVPRFKTCCPGHHILLIQASILLLLGAIATAQECNYQQRVCECDPGQTECYFTLLVEKLSSFTSYKLSRDSPGISMFNAPSSSYIINSAGRLQPADNATEDPSICLVYNENFADNNCSIPMTIDSTYEAVIKTINGLIPGPTLVVNYNQTVVVDVTNNLINEELAIHWHGIHQNSTPWMDGVGHISHCPIPVLATFRYIFKAVPSGTMWYHSHTGIQRIQGIFGALIVREPSDLMEIAKKNLQGIIDEKFELLDEPHLHTMTFLDWSMQAILHTLNAYYNPSIPLPVHSGLINGLGREINVSYKKSRLSIFNVRFRNEDSLLYYRFRLIGAQDFYMYRFSIEAHKLTVIAADGKLTEPFEVDYLSIHSGERYDILLKPKTEAEANGRTNYYIIGETIQMPVTYMAEGILHYGTDEDQPLATEFEEIITSSVPKNCTEASLCTNLNCPFLEYPAGTFVRCIPVTQMQLLLGAEDVPSNNIEDENEYFFDFSLFQPSFAPVLSGRTSVLPSGSLQTLPNDLMDQNICQLGQVNCIDDPELCTCTHLISLDTQFATVQFVFTSIGDSGQAYHAVHLHGHSFQVVSINYAIYDINGSRIAVNPNVTCHNDPRCTNPTWTSSRVDGGEVTSKTIHKDTIVVPTGGYVVIRFIVDNPGYWFMHCHIDSHIVEGMTLVIRELIKLHNPPPKQLAMQHCGNFNFTVDDFDKLIAGSMN